METKILAPQDGDKKAFLKELRETVASGDGRVPLWPISTWANVLFLRRPIQLRPILIKPSSIWANCLLCVCVVCCVRVLCACVVSVCCVGCP